MAHDANPPFPQAPMDRVDQPHIPFASPEICETEDVAGQRLRANPGNRRQAPQAFDHSVPDSIVTHQGIAEAEDQGSGFTVGSGRPGFAAIHSPAPVPARGSRTVNVLPLPGSDSRCSLPARSLVALCTMARPIPVPGDSVLAYEYTGGGMRLVRLPDEALEDVAAIRYLGNATIEKHPVLEDWELGSPRQVDPD